MTANVILLEVQPRNVATGVRQTVRLAGAGAVHPYQYGGNAWKAGLVNIPELVAALDYQGSDLGTGAVPQAVAVQWADPGTRYIDTLAALHWENAPFTIYLGPENAAGTMPPAYLTGKVLTHKVVDSVLQLAMADPAADLKRPLVTDTFAGTGGVEGPAEWRGRLKRRAWGWLFNVEGFAIDPANNIHSFGDPARPWQAFDAVRDKGAAAASLVLLGWQGSVAATFAALQAASAPQGGGVVCPSIAMVKWWTRPAGILAADIRGETPIGGTFLSSAPEIAQLLVESRAGPTFTAGTVAAAKAARPDECGFMADSSQQTIANALDWLLGGVSLFWALEPATGTIRLGAWEFGASQGTFTSDAVQREAGFPPLQQRRLGYRRNHRIHSAGDIAAVVTYGDGTPIDDERPGAVGLLDTLPLTSPLLTGQLPTGSAASGLVNANVSIGANGTLAGGGGGQVTIGGLGYYGELGATASENLFPNGYISDAGASGYVLGTNVTVTAAAVGDPAPFKLRWTATGSYTQLPRFTQRMGAGAGDILFIEAWVKGDLANNNNCRLYFRIQFFDAQGSLCGTQAAGYQIPAANTWSRIRAKSTGFNHVVVPANTTSFRVDCYGIVGAGATFVEATGFRASTIEYAATKGADWLVNTTSRPSNLAALTGTEGVNNANVSIGANGTLAGGGGGQVTYVGLGGGALGLLGTLDLGTAYAVGTLPVARAAAGLVNAGVSIGANGALAGAGGGQVTIGGLGYVGDLNATLGAGWTTNLTGRPSNLSALAGTEGLNNALVSIAANGALAGAGGGQVTISGLGYAGDLDAERNSRLELVYDTGGTGGRARQLLRNTGAAAFYTSQFPDLVQNLNIALSGANITGIGTGSGTAVANSAVSIAANGALAGGGGGQVTFSGLGGGALGLLAALDLANTGLTTGLLPTTRAAAGLLNSGISIAANGALAGGGGGQVTPTGLGIEDGADVTKAASGPAQLVLNYSNDGSLVTPLPLYGTFKLTPAGGSNYTSGVSWAVSVEAGTFAGTAPSISGAGLGQLAVNSELASPESTLKITPTYGGKAYPPVTCKIVRQTATASQSGGSGGGTLAKDTSLSSFSTSSFVAVSDDLSVTTGSGVTSVSLVAANLSLELTGILGGAIGSTTCQFKWQRETSPGTWADIGAVATSSPSPEVVEDGEGFREAVPGSMTCNRTESGLSGSTTYKFRLVARVSAGNIRTVVITGEASGQG